MVQSLEFTRACARRLRFIDAGMAAASGLVCAGVYLASEGELGRPGWVVAGVAAVMFALGIGVFLVRVVHDRRIVRALVEQPHTIARMFPKRVEGAIWGATVSRYGFIVLELVDGTTLDVYAPKDDFDAVRFELRAAAPESCWLADGVTERTNVRVFFRF
jgi:hypothetical protein